MSLGGAVLSHQPTNGAAGKINDILRKLIENASQSEAIKTCFGFLAVLSRDNSNKQIIIKDCLEQIICSMNNHIDKCDVQESGCDLLWSLAFNNAFAKEAVSKSGGTTVIVRALKKHSKSFEFLKSACGALSNVCQYRLNQDEVAAQGGLQPLVGSVHAHQSNAKLLPFIFDAIASITVGNDDNAKAVSTLGLIQLLLNCLSKYKLNGEIVKSGCHALAILSDVKGQASKIAFSGGVPIILNILDSHPSFADLHRVSAVVILRMLQESANVVREIICNEGVRVLLKSLEKGGAQQDTVAAVTHILYTITNPSNPNPSLANIETQLWNANNVRGGGSAMKPETNKLGQGLLKNGSDKVQSSNPNAADISAQNAVSGVTQQSTLTGLVQAIGFYTERKDVIRAACRLIRNLSTFAGVLPALEKMNIVDRLFECVAHHKETKDVIESTTTMIKALSKKNAPLYLSSKFQSIIGIIHLMEIKIEDEELIIGCADILTLYFENTQNNCNGSISSDPKRNEQESQYMASNNGISWIQNLLKIINKIVSSINNSTDEGALLPIDGDGQPTIEAEDNSTAGAAGLLPKRPAFTWTKFTSKMVLSLYSLLGQIMCSRKIDDKTLFLESHKISKVLYDKLPSTSGDLPKKIEKILSVFAVLLKIDNSTSNQRKDSNLSSTSSNTINGESSENNSTTTGSFDVASNYRSLQKNQTLSQSEVNEARTKGEGSESNKLRDSDTGTNNNPMKSSGNANNTAPIFSRVPLKSENPNAPKHPLKHVGKFDSSKPATRLLDGWPQYLERLSYNGFYSSVGNINASNQNKEERMHVVYECSSAAGLGLRSRIDPPTPYVVPSSGVGPEFEHSLTFDSEFESGNLQTAIQRDDAEYDLFLRADVHTGGHTQWFYFAVANTHPASIVKLSEQGVAAPPVKVRFNILNLTKPDSLFNLGMRPVVYSCCDAAKKGVGWIRSGNDISYYSNNYSRCSKEGEGNNTYYTLSFTIEFHNPKDTVLIAYTYPYTTYDHKYYMHQIMSKLELSSIIRQFKLCTSLGGEDVDLYVVSNFNDKERIGPLLTLEDNGGNLNGNSSGPGYMSKSGRSKDRSSPKCLKPALFLSCRVHPGEPPASWMMKGILDFITSSSAQAQLLRQSFVIFVVPMLNPDGVIYGNNRCCLAGVDLNRQWKTPSKSLHPSIHYLKTLMANQKKIRDIYMYIDLHGHSRKSNVFMYGCDEKKKGQKESRAPLVREFPRFLSNHPIGRKYVSFEDCSFHINKGRESTARVVVAKELNIPYSYTLEASFCGSDYGPLKSTHMNIGHLQEVGATLCDSILNYSISDGFIKDICCINAPINGIMSNVNSYGGDNSLTLRNNVIEDREQMSHSSKSNAETRDMNDDVAVAGNSSAKHVDVDSDSDNDSGIDDKPKSRRNSIGLVHGNEKDKPEILSNMPGSSNFDKQLIQSKNTARNNTISNNNSNCAVPLPSPPFSQNNFKHPLKASGVNLHLNRIVNPTSDSSCLSLALDTNSDPVLLSDPRVEKTSSNYSASHNPSSAASMSNRMIKTSHGLSILNETMPSIVADIKLESSASQAKIPLIKFDNMGSLPTINSHQQFKY